MKLGGRFLTGAGSYGCTYVSIVHALEMAGDRTRTFVGINIEITFAIGEAVVSLVGIRVKDWRQFQVSKKKGGERRWGF